MFHDHPLMAATCDGYANHRKLLRVNIKKKQTIFVASTIPEQFDQRKEPRLIKPVNVFRFLNGSDTSFIKKTFSIIIGKKHDFK